MAPPLHILRNDAGVPGEIDEAKPCDVVPLSGYFVTTKSGEMRLYTNRSYRQWTVIPEGSFKAHTATEAQQQRGLSTLYLDRNATVIECEAILVSSYDSQSRTAMGPSEDMGEYEVPRYQVPR